MQSPLTKSYISQPPKSPKYDLFHKAFADMKKSEKPSLLVNMDTKERVSNLDILAQAENFAKGLLSLNLIPGVDSIALIGCSTFEALALFAAAAEIGIGFTHLFIHPPREEKITTQMTLLAPKVIICGEGAGGHNASALFSLLDTEATGKVSSRLPFLEHIFYDSSYKDRSPTHKSVKTLYRLKELGESVSDDQLTEARERVQPGFIIQYLFTSGSTGRPKCTSRTQAALVRIADSSGFEETKLISNMNVDGATSYAFLIMAILRPVGTVVMIPETYEERPIRSQGELLTEVIIKERVSTLTVTISVVGAIIDYMREAKILLPHPLKAIVLAGQIISRQFIREIKKVTQAAVVIIYGMTELLGVGVGFPGTGDEARLQIQQGTELRIVDEHNQVVDIGEVGEIQAKNTLVFKEYKDNEEQTKQIFTDDGFIKTGDAGLMFSDRTFKVLGRMNDNDRFNIHGKVEYPAPIEEIFNRHPEIRQAYVVSGKQNDWIGDEITCCIQTKEKSSKIAEERLVEFWKSNGLYLRQQPARILYFEEFPFVENGRKVSKEKLRRQVREMVAEDESLGKCQWFIDLENSGKTY